MEGGREEGEVGAWLALLGDLIFFGAFCGITTVYHEPSFGEEGGRGRGKGGREGKVELVSSDLLRVEEMETEAMHEEVERGELERGEDYYFLVVVVERVGGQVGRQAGGVVYCRRVGGRTGGGERTAGARAVGTTCLKSRCLLLYL